jgi:uncharacterized lipoprotein NlpE involved in copper resistance
MNKITCTLVAINLLLLGCKKDNNDTTDSSISYLFADEYQ